MRQPIDEAIAYNKGSLYSTVYSSFDFGAMKLEPDSLPLEKNIFHFNFAFVLRFFLKKLVISR